MKRGNTAAGALRGAVFNPEHEHRAMISFDHAARDNAHHSAMPSFAREHQRRVVIGHDLFDALFENRERDLGFGLLAILIQVVKLRRDGPARSVSEVQNSSITSLALAMRPAALMRGAREKRFVRASGPIRRRPDRRRRAARAGPDCGRRAVLPDPRFTMTRFSPVSGTTSATVAIATSFRNDSTKAARFG